MRSLAKTLRFHAADDKAFDLKWLRAYGARLTTRLARPTPVELRSARRP
jgi:hypothetical protein